MVGRQRPRCAGPEREEQADHEAETQGGVHPGRQERVVIRPEFEQDVFLRDGLSIRSRIFRVGKACSCCHCERVPMNIGSPGGAINRQDFHNPLFVQSKTTPM